MKVWRIYEVIDVESGEILNKDQRKNYITVSKETIKTKNNGYIIETQRRYVRHNRQQRIDYL